jgi:hypothetical protein
VNRVSPFSGANWFSTRWTEQTGPDSYYFSSPSFFVLTIQLDGPGRVGYGEVSWSNTDPSQFYAIVTTGSGVNLTALKYQGDGLAKYGSCSLCCSQMYVDTVSVALSVPGPAVGAELLLGLFMAVASFIGWRCSPAKRP